MEKRKIKFKILEILSLFIYSFLLYIFTYIIKYENIWESIYIIKYLILAGGIQYLIVSYLIILSILFIMKGIIGDSFKSKTITTIIVLIITVVSYYKNNILELPFLPADILLVRNVNQIAKFGLQFPSIYIILSGLVLCLILRLEYWVNKKYTLSFKEKTVKTYIFRTSVFLIGVILFYNLCISPTRYIKFEIKNDLGNNYSWMGGNAVFFMHLGDFYTVLPKGYNKENIEQMKEEALSNYKELDEEINKPNVIIIMNESFSDPNKIQNVYYSDDPIKGIKTLNENDKNCIIGNSISPVFGRWNIFAGI